MRLRAELLVDDAARQAVPAAAEPIWEDLLNSVELDTAALALLTDYSYDCASSEQHARAPRRPQPLRAR
jgi:hypothetical protein